MSTIEKNNKAVIEGVLVVGGVEVEAFDVYDLNNNPKRVPVGSTIAKAIKRTKNKLENPGGIAQEVIDKHNDDIAAHDVIQQQIDNHVTGTHIGAEIATDAHVADTEAHPNINTAISAVATAIATHEGDLSAHTTLEERVNEAYAAAPVGFSFTKMYDVGYKIHFPKVFYEPGGPVHVLGAITENVQFTPTENIGYNTYDKSPWLWSSTYSGGVWRYVGYGLRLLREGVALVPQYVSRENGSSATQLNHYFSGLGDTWSLDGRVVDPGSKGPSWYGTYENPKFRRMVADYSYASKTYSNVIGYRLASYANYGILFGGVAGNHQSPTPISSRKLWQKPDRYFKEGDVSADLADDCPQVPYKMHHHFGFWQQGPTAYMSGGFCGKSTDNSSYHCVSKKVFSFDLTKVVTDENITRTELPELPKARAYHSMFLLGGKLYIIGGYEYGDGETVPINRSLPDANVLVLSDDGTTWNEVPHTMPRILGGQVTRWYSKIAFIGGSLYNEAADEAEDNTALYVFE